MKIQNVNDAAFSKYSYPLMAVRARTVRFFLFLGTVDRESALRADPSLHQRSASWTIHHLFLLF
jgi:hypothetical protein